MGQYTAMGTELFETDGEDLRSLENLLHNTVNISARSWVFAPRTFILELPGTVYYRSDS